MRMFFSSMMTRGRPELSTGGAVGSASDEGEGFSPAGPSATKGRPLTLGQTVAQSPYKHCGAKITGGRRGPMGPAPAAAGPPAASGPSVARPLFLLLPAGGGVVLG